MPLNDLLRKGVVFVWSNECEKAFQELMAKLIEPLLLIHPEIGGHFYVLIDASVTG